MPDKILVFDPFQFKPGQKIYISSGKRKGDWEVVGYDGEKVVLRCPVSGIELSVVQFCYLVNETIQEWPQRD